MGIILFGVFLVRGGEKSGVRSQESEIKGQESGIRSNGSGDGMRQTMTPDS